MYAAVQQKAHWALQQLRAPSNTLLEADFSFLLDPIDCMQTHPHSPAAGSPVSTAWQGRSGVHSCS